MGVVFEASHKRLPRRFAIKVLSPSVLADPEAVVRFQREAQITSSLGHPNIIEVVDFNKTEEGTPYIVMEFLDGEDLAALLARSPRLDIARSLAIVEQVCSALQAAHKLGVIHRDLKPSNIFLCKQQDDEAEGDLVKVVDFGISKVLGATGLTQAQSTIGTPWYMSPEQAEGRSAQVDARTDIFSLGTILYEMLCGSTPFAAETIPAVLYKVVHHDPPPLSEQRSDAPAAVVAAVGRAMSKAPAHRFATMGDFAATLKGAAAVTREPAAAGCRRFRRDGRHASRGRASYHYSCGRAARRRSCPHDTSAPGYCSPRPPRLPPRAVLSRRALSAPRCREQRQRSMFDQRRPCRFRPAAQSSKLAVAAGVFVVLVAGGTLLLRSMGQSDDPAPTVDAPGPAAARAPAHLTAMADLSAGPMPRSTPIPALSQRSLEYASNGYANTRSPGRAAEKGAVCTLFILGRGVEIRRVPCLFEVAHGTRIKLKMVVNNSRMAQIWERVVRKDMHFSYSIKHDARVIKTESPPTPEEPAP